MLAALAKESASSVPGPGRLGGAVGGQQCQGWQTADLSIGDCMARVWPAWAGGEWQTPPVSPGVGSWGKERRAEAWNFLRVGRRTATVMLSFNII